jgi:hypothetical protein
LVSVEDGRRAVAVDGFLHGCAFKVLAQQLIESMGGAMPVQDFPGPIVEQGLYPFALGSRQPSEPGALGKELAQPPFVFSFVPRVRPHLNSGQFVEQYNPSILQSIQPSSSLPFSRDSRVHSIVTLVRDPRLSSGAMGFE